jgi:hypothetical protein
MENVTKKRAAEVISLTPRRRKVIDLVKFIDARGGKLGAFRGYGPSSRVPPPADPDARPAPPTSPASS